MRDGFRRSLEEEEPSAAAPYCTEKGIP
jgi:hypothetical protein